MMVVVPGGRSEGRDCRRCYFSQVPALDDRFYLEAVRPYCYMAAFMLFFSYLIGLWFTLRTHRRRHSWNYEVEEKRQEDHMHASSVLRPSQPSAAETSSADIRDTHLYKRILGQSLKQVGLPTQESGRQPSVNSSDTAANGAPSTLHFVPPKSVGADGRSLGKATAGLGQGDNSAPRS